MIMDNICHEISLAGVLILGINLLSTQFSSLFCRRVWLVKNSTTQYKQPPHLCDCFINPVNTLWQTSHTIPLMIGTGMKL